MWKFGFFFFFWLIILTGKKNVQFWFQRFQRFSGNKSLFVCFKKTVVYYTTGFFLLTDFAGNQPGWTSLWVITTSISSTKGELNLDEWQYENEIEWSHTISSTKRNLIIFYFTDFPLSLSLKLSNMYPFYHSVVFVVVVF